MGVPYDTALDDRFKATVELLAELPDEEEELPDDDVVSGPVPQPLKTVRKKRQRINMTVGRRNFRYGLLLIIFLLFKIENLHVYSIINPLFMHV